MKPFPVMLIAGDPSGDMLAAEFARALRDAAGQQGRELRAFGAGGAHLVAAGVECAFDLTQHSIIGFNDALRGYFQLRRLAHQLIELAIERRPRAIVCVDFSGFNRRFAHELRKTIRARGIPAAEWSPRIIQYVSPQVWASRPGRAAKMARDFDLLLAIFPFEQAWYAQRLPDFPVEFVGHPIVERHSAARISPRHGAGEMNIVLLPGSRRSELKRHLALVVACAARIRAAHPGAVVRLVLPNAEMQAFARTVCPLPAFIQVQIGGLAEALSGATLALASTGTVTLECAWFGVPTVAFYRLPWLTALLAHFILTVKYVAMPNLLANQEVYPEFLQHAATPARVSAAALELLASAERQAVVRRKLADIAASLGEPGAARRAADAVLRLVGPP